MGLKEQIDIKRIPKHVAIIMDGNGRWAKQHGKLRAFGHKSGVKSVREAVEACREIGVKYLTVYAFSTENWNRPKLEVMALMELMVSTIHKEVEGLLKNGVRLNTIGNIDALPKRTRNELLDAVEKTSGNTELTLTLALSYSSRWEITEAIKNIVKKAADGELAPADITEQTLSDHLHTRNMPDPELLIRTSGEYRISNYLLWQIAYAELYFTQKHWPDFKKDDFFEAIIDYQKRERRFGMTSEQLN
ncbi:MAG: isoprenyl transferase [Mucilaginibacter polytrichastri]|nr:isoprenyl transferase [Mucilaginibacter polytrichastri]